MLPLLILLLRLINIAIGGKILFNGMHASPSHIASMLPLANKLAENGHEIHFLETSPNAKPFKYPANIQYHFIRFPAENLNATLALTWTMQNRPYYMAWLFSVGDSVLEQMLDDHYEKIKPILDETWDLIISDELFGMSSMGLAMRNHRLHGKPYIMYSTTVLDFLFSWESALARMPHARPSMWLVADENGELNYDVSLFEDRFYTFYDALVAAIPIKYLTEYFNNGGIRKLGLKDFTFTQLWSDSSLNFHEEIDQFAYPMPVASDVKTIGQHCPSIRPLAENFLHFINDPNSRGTIYIAFGTNVRWDFAPPRILNAFQSTLNALSEYRIIFAFDGEHVPKFGDHVMVLRWAPQYDILSHHKTVLFISHGGLKSLKEAICAAIPVVYMPLFAEQTHNVMLAKRMGFAESLDKLTLTSKKMREAVERVLHNPTYKKQAEKMHRHYLDRPIPSLDEGLFWVNRIINLKNGRKPAFQRKGVLLNWIQSIFAIDTIVIIVVILLMSK